VVIFGFDASGNGSSGTGSIVTPDGKVLTNNHVIYDPKTRAPFKNIKVFLKPSRITGSVEQDLKNPYSVRVLARDSALDLAVLQVLDAPNRLPVLPMGDSESVEVGSSVAAIGHPGGGGLWTLTTGTISSTRKDASRAIFQTDAAINPGNSGGPLLNGDSQMIGVNTFVRRVNAEGLPLEGLNYSLRSSLVRDWMSGQGVRVAFARPVQHSVPPRDSSPASPLPAPRRELESRTDPVPAPPPSYEPPREMPTRPRPQVRIDPETGPPSTPETSRARSAPSARAGDDEPRVFKGPNGEMMYGVPDSDFDLKGAGKAVYQRARKNARDAFDSLDSEFE
jgi:serine protease Do